MNMPPQGQARQYRPPSSQPPRKPSPLPQASLQQKSTIAVNPQQKPLQPHSSSHFRYSQRPAIRNASPQPILDQYSSMMKRCAWSIRKMLDELLAIYQEYSVRFPVQHLQETLQRMLIPAEFRPLVDVNEIYYLIQSKANATQFISAARARQDFATRDQLYTDPRRGDFNQRFKTQLNPRFQHEKPQSISQPISQPMPQPMSQPMSQPMPQPMPQPQNPPLRLIPEQKKEYFRKQVRPHSQYPAMEDRYQNRYNQSHERKPGVRSRGIEGHLCAWVVSEYERGIPLNRVDVIEKARELGKNSNLKASVGWYSNFIRRNPDIRDILNKSSLRRPGPQPGSRLAPRRNYPIQNSMKNQESEDMMYNIYDDEQEQSKGRPRPAQPGDEEQKQEESYFSQELDYERDNYGLNPNNKRQLDNQRPREEDKEQFQAQNLVQQGQSDEVEPQGNDMKTRDMNRYGKEM